MLWAWLCCEYFHSPHIILREILRRFHNNNKMSILSLTHIHCTLIAENNAKLFCLVPLRFQQFRSCCNVIYNITIFVPSSDAASCEEGRCGKANILLLQ